MDKPYASSQKFPLPGDSSFSNLGLPQMERAYEETLPAADIATQLKVLEARVCFVYESVAALAERLAPVLTAEPPMPANELTAVRENPSPQTELGGKLCSIREQINATSATLDQLHRRLGL
jgi:hypothetical protein